MRPLILITNDDGIMSPGLMAIVEAVRDLGDLLVCAPRFQQTNMGRSFTDDALSGRVEIIASDHCRYRMVAVHGSPAQSVSHAILELATRPPSICISGINYGENLGTSIFHSGTIGAALEAHTYGVPGLAVSIEASLESHTTTNYPSLEFGTAQRLTRRLVRQVLEYGLQGDIALLNVNVPAEATDETEVRVTSQSNQHYYVFERPGRRDFAMPLKLKTVIVVDEDTLEIDSDIRAFAVDRVISITPMSANVTAAGRWTLRCEDLEGVCRI
jgi:5'/3'-nucleotidase